MSKTELIRPEYGTPYERGIVTEIKDDDGYTRRIVRDARGRIAGIEGRTKVDDLADTTANLADTTANLATTVDGIVADLAKVSKTAKRLDKTAKRLDKTAATSTACDTVAISERLAKLEGWEPVLGGLLVNTRAVQTIARKFGIRWPITVDFHSQDADYADGRHGWYTYTPEGGHRVHVYQGLGIERSSYVIAHELAHAAQLVRLREKFLAIYAEYKDDLEDEAETMAKSVAHVELVRSNGHSTIAMARAAYNNGGGGVWVRS